MATQNLTSTLTTQMSTFYDKVFLERYKALLVFGVGAKSKKIGRNMGKAITFNRMSVPTLSTTPLTEGSNPTEIALTSNQINAIVTQYGAFTQTSDFFELTSIDAGLKEQVQVMAQHGAETVNQLIRKTVTSFQTTPGSTIQRAAGRASDNLIVSTDVLTGQEIRRAVRTLKSNKAMTFEDGYFKAIIPVEAAYDLRGSTEWLDAYRYVDPSNIQNGEIGRLHGVRFYETNDATVTAGGTVTATQNFAPSGTAANAALSIVGGATVTAIHETFIMGRESYAIVEIEGSDSGKDAIVIIKTPGANDTSNALNMYQTIGWKATFTTVSLNPAWILAVRTAVGV